MFEFRASYWLFCYLTTAVCGTTLQIQKIQVPSPVMTGSDVVLRCLYKDVDPSSSFPIGPAGAGPLYSLKWYKGSHEFYRHYPMEDPPTTVVSWSSFNIEADNFEPGRVILRNIDMDADGSYTCEVSSEGTFHTDTAVANLTVIDVRNVELNLTQVPDVPEARTGDLIRWNCTFGQSRPRANITWLINGEPVTLGSRRMANGHHEDSADEDAKRLEWTHSVLEMSLAERHFKNQWLKVSCVATIMSNNNSTFKKTAELRIRHKHHGNIINNPSPVVGLQKHQASMAKIAGSPSTATRTVITFFLLVTLQTVTYFSAC